jgi:multimeric flavodoxin WrbA
MKALVINSSPHMDKGNTTLILTPFIAGMKEAGADVEIFYTKKLKIEPCDGCFTCWLKTPGICVHKDDMAIILPKLEAEILVFATPLYVDGMTGPMKTFMDRSVPLLQPFFELRNGHYRHPVRDNIKGGGKVVLIASCGFWEMDNFEPLVQHFEAYCRNANREFAGALFRPHGGSLAPMIRAGLAFDIIEAAKEAGRQVVKAGKISEITLKTISRELMPTHKYFEQVNRSFKLALDANAKNKLL